ncbi:MAG: enoyl-CoA hydratase/isomerase family protein [Gemmatimonadales bacterium]
MTEELLSRTDGPMYRITLNRPARRNALTPELARELAHRLDGVEEDSGVELVVLTGAAGHFCAGLDLTWLRAVGDTASTHELQRGLGDFQAAVLAVVRCPAPVIAVVQGFAAGFGLDLAVACDLRIAGTSARFTSAFARMGLVPDGGSTFTLPRLVGVGPALRLLMAGETLDAVQAHAIGLVDEVVDDASMEEGMKTVTDKLFAAAPASIRAIKRLVRAGELGALEQTLATEGAAQLQALQTPEFRRRLEVFLSR